jgi:hypothetical protein
MESGAGPLAGRDDVDCQLNLVPRGDIRIAKPLIVSSSTKHAETGHESKKSDPKMKNDTSRSLSSSSPKLVSKPSDLKLTPTFLRKSSPLLTRQKHKRTKSADKVSLGFKKVSSAVDLSDSVRLAVDVMFVLPVIS